jgi:hypothetical protein
MADWVNWGDFVGANQQALNDYDTRVGQTNFDQSAAAQKASQSYSDAVMAAGSAYSQAAQDAKAAAEASSKEGYNQSAAAATTAKDNEAMASAYKATVDARNNAQGLKSAYDKSAFKGYTGASPWEAALYGGQQQSVDPWAGLDEKMSAADNSATDKSGATNEAVNGAAPTWLGASWGDPGAGTWTAPKTAAPPPPKPRPIATPGGTTTPTNTTAAGAGTNKRQY